MTLEELLNKLIKLWWSVWKNYPRYCEVIYKYKWNWIDKYTEISVDFYRENKLEFSYTLNDLCSIDSGLWQFVIQNKLYEKNIYNKWVCIDVSMKSYWKDELVRYKQNNIEYRLILSSIQEDKEKFIIDNITNLLTK